MTTFSLIIAIVLFCNLCFLQTFCATLPPESPPIISTRYGQIMGKTLKSESGREFNAFRGIPYAKPPVGDLRFRAPERLDPWNGTWDATKDGPFCIQVNYFFYENATVTGSEDCLYLNVYVPYTKGIKPHLLPVMVFIHYGGFFAGQATSDVLGPEYLMNRNIILVTFNYRLGVFGLLSTLDDNAPGNYALKDQVAALEWVQENIQNFGGNKDKVTLFGQSAGAGSVHLHMISPLSRGLFHRAISQSGTALNLWAKPFNNIQKFVAGVQGSLVQCTSTNSTLLIECLRKVDAKVLAQSADYFKYFSIEPLTPYSLVTETQTAANPRPFLEKEPLDYLMNGEFQKVPWIIGVVKNEGIIRAGPLLRQPKTRQTLNDKFSEYIPKMLYLELSNKNFSSLYNNITKFYLNSTNSINIINKNWVQGFINLYSDRSFNYGVYQTINLHLAKNHNNIWFYRFNYRGSYSYGDLFSITDKNIDFKWGVCHCDDLLYLFKSPKFFGELPDKDKIISSIMTKYWTTFATYGYPVKSLLDLKNPKWNPVTLYKNRLKVFNIEPFYKTNAVYFYPVRMRFWKNQTLQENFIL